jgi:NAD(P)-dependent dehydrogenase (short-subunit alcohol dehydrogenase family)
MSRTTLRNKTILITGATSGLGRALALKLAAGNNRFIVTGRRLSLLESLAVELRAAGSECFIAAVDATDTAAVAAHLQANINELGRIDVAVLNAGGGEAHVLGRPGTTADEVLRIMNKNYASMVNYLCPLIEHMKQQGGTIAYTSSPAGMFGLPKSGPYSAAKAAGRILFDTARIELGNTPIRFVALYPGFTYTDGLVSEEVPFKSLIIQPERAVREMIYAIERGRDHHIFPARIAWPIRLGRMLPEPVRRFILSRVAG